MKNNFYIIFVLFCLLAGCVAQSVPPVDIYTISPEWADTITQGEREKKSLFIIQLAPMHATRALKGTEILYTDTQYGWNSYAYSRWNDAPVQLLQMVFQVAMEKNDLFKAVVPPTYVSEADLLLESTLLDLSHHIKDDETSEGVVRVRFYLINNTTKTVTSTKEFISRVTVVTQNAQGAVKALNKAAANVARDLVAWLAEPGRIET